MRILFVVFFIAVSLMGCAHYQATSLTPISIKTSDETPTHGILVAAKAFTKAESIRYLDRDLMRKGYQPIQLSIENISDKTYMFSTSRVHLALASPEEVAQKAHTSTLGRITGYGAAALIATPLFIIPAVVDGYQSLHANSALDKDFQGKAAKDQILAPFSQSHMLLFVPVESMQDSFTMVLLDEKTNKPLRILVPIKNA